MKTYIYILFIYATYFIVHRYPVVSLRWYAAALDITSGVSMGAQQESSNGLARLNRRSCHLSYCRNSTEFPHECSSHRDKFKVLSYFYLRFHTAFKHSTTRVWTFQNLGFRDFGHTPAILARLDSIPGTQLHCKSEIFESKFTYFRNFKQRFKNFVKWSTWNELLCTLGRIV